MMLPTKCNAIALLGLCFAFGSAAGCSCGDSSSATTMSSSTSGTSMGTNSTGPGGGGGTPGMIQTATSITSGVAFDATLSSDGSVAYFTGITDKGNAGVFSVPSSGGAALVLTEGDPLIAPFGIAISTDGKTLYLADPAATTGDDEGGKIFSVSEEGGAPKPFASTEKAVPRSLEVVNEKGSDVVYFSGEVAGEPGVFKVGPTGSGLTTIAKGSPFRDPAGIAVASDGTVYVVDTIAGSHHDASIVSISKAGKASLFLDHLDVGYPAGIAVSSDDATLIVSGLREDDGHACVLQVDTQSKEILYFPSDTDKKSPFDALVEPGGLHRAHAANRFAWVVADADGGGVYLLK